MDLAKITKAAQTEYKAEQRKTQSDAAWRTAWWNLTLMLAEVEGQGEVAKANATVKDELGCSLSWLASRRKTGKVVKSILGERLTDVQTINTWTPKLATIWCVDLKRTADGMVDTLNGAEENALSIRAFIQEQGGIPMSTGRERFAPTPPPRTREEKVAIGREILADEDVATEVMRDRDARLNAGRATARVATRDIEARRRDEALEDPNKAKREAEQDKHWELTQAQVELKKDLAEAKRRGISALGHFDKIRGMLGANGRDLLVEDIQDVINVFQALLEGAHTNKSVDTELARLLAEGA